MGLLNDKDLDKYLALIGTFFACELRDKQDDAFANETYRLFCAVREHIYTLMKNNEWISVKDRLPEEDVPVLVWELQGFAYVDVYKDGVWEVGTPNLAKFTHWMPLPKPPKEVTQDG